jgi:apolipoprotein N-acyltransferase
MIKKKDILFALISGILLVLGFPPFDFFPLAWIALIPLLYTIWEKKTKASFFLGTLTGFVCFTGTTYWIFNSVYFYGDIPAIFSLLIVFVLCLYLGLYLGVFSMLFTYLSRHSKFPALFIAPVLWVTLEFVRTYALTGFPWSVLGYTQYTFLPVIQIADITGVYGVSFLIVAVNGAIFDVVAYWPNRLARMPLVDRWPMAVGLVALALCLLLSTLYGVWRLKTGDEGSRLRASVIQGNFEQEKKWDINFKREIIDTYKQLTREASSLDPDIIAWPESSVPFVFGQEESLTKEIVEFQKTMNNHLLFGSMMVKGVKGSTYELANSVILMSPEGDVVSVYDKIHLVPYGEYVPLRKIFPFIGKLVVAIGDFKRGKHFTVMETPTARISSPICYEIIFPGMVRKFVKNGANLLVTVTNDAWFGRSSAPYQHFSMAVLRAVENRVPVIRAANTGISGFIDARGKIKGKSEIFVKAVLTDDLFIGSFDRSFYTKYGDLFVFFCIMSTVLFIANNISPKK